MIVFRFFPAVLALAALTLLGGCGAGDSAVTTAETDESLYVQAQQYKRQGRNPDALLNFLKVIEKRGERPSPESHLEAGLIYKDNLKDYNEAIHHFQRYLQLQPNSPQAAGVRGLIDSAKREFWRTFATRANDEAASVNHTVELERLQRENSELRAELAATRGGGGAPARLPRTPTIMIDTSASERPPAPGGGATGGALPPRNAFTERSAQVPAAPPAGRPAPGPASMGRRYTIKKGDTLFSIAKQYAGSGSPNAKVQEIFEANRDVMNNINALPPIGTELKVP